MLDTSSKSPPDVVGWDIVATFDNSLPHPTDRFTHIRNPDEVQLDLIASLLRVFENVNVGSPAECRFKRECLLSIYQLAQLAQKKFSGFECDGFGLEWR
jgi:hypothetical protein